MRYFKSWVVGQRAAQKRLQAVTRRSVCWLAAVHIDREIAMVNSKAEPDSLIEEMLAFAKSVRVEPPMPRAIVDPDRKMSVREYIVQLVTAFKAHQQRFIREREEHAAAELKRMQN